MIEVSKRQNERIESMLRRFRQKVQRSGILLRAREKMFHQRSKSKRKIREEAKARQEHRKEREYLRKIGKLEEK